MPKIRIIRNRPAVVEKKVTAAVRSVIRQRRTKPINPNGALRPQPVVRKSNAAIQVMAKRLEVNQKQRQHPSNVVRRSVVSRRQPPHIKHERQGRRNIRRLGRVVSTEFIKRIQALRNIGNGKVLVMLACGPSVKNAPLGKLINNPKIDFMAINRPYGYYQSQVPKEHADIWPARFWVFCDHSQYARNTDAWTKYKGIIINSPAIRQRHPSQIIIRNRGGRGFSKDLALGYHIGRSSTFANMQVAYYMGYDRVYIFGLDMGEVGGQLHHYGRNPDVSPKIRLQRFALEADNYNFAVQSLTEKEREKFYICSSHNKFSFVDQFSRLGEVEAPDHILEYLKQDQEQK